MVSNSNKMPISSSAFVVNSLFVLFNKVLKTHFINNFVGVERMIVREENKYLITGIDP